MEALQLLKHALRKEHLNFMAGWKTSDDAMSGVSKPVLGDALSSLVEENRDQALDDLLKGFITSES